MAHNPGPTSHDAHNPRLPRPAVRISAYLEAGGRRRRILITEYSPLGLTLDRTAGIELDERVTVELRWGQRLPVRVVWVRGEKAGVRFLGPIVPGHPVLQLLELAAKGHQARQASSTAR
jgi:hypothetical protein